MPQDQEYLAAHAILLQKDEQIAALEARVAQLEADNAELVAQLEMVLTPEDLDAPLSNPITTTGKKRKTSN